jgi:hypothetical protein
MYGTPLINTSLSSDTNNWTISNIPSGYKHLNMVFVAKTAFTQHGPQLRWSWNNESSTNTHFNGLENVGQGFVYGPEAGSFRQRGIMRGDAPATLFGYHRTFIPNYSNTSIKKTIWAWHTTPFGGPLDGLTWNSITANCFDNTTGLSSIVMMDNSGNTLKSGSRVYIYGVS